MHPTEAFVFSPFIKKFHVWKRIKNFGHTSSREHRFHLWWKGKREEWEKQKERKGKEKKKKMRRGGDELPPDRSSCESEVSLPGCTWNWISYGRWGTKTYTGKKVAVLYLRAWGDLPSLIFLSTNEAPKMQVPQILWNLTNVRCLSPLKQNDRYPFYKQNSSGSLPGKGLKGCGFENAGPCSAPVLCPTFRMTHSWSLPYMPWTL